MSEERGENRTVHIKQVQYANNRATQFFVWWVMVQLVVIGLAGSVYFRSIENGTYDCHTGDTQVTLQDGSTAWVHEIGAFSSTVMGIAFPLLFFVPEDLEFTGKRLAFCEGK